MDGTANRSVQRRHLLDEQLKLLKAKRGEVEVLRGRGSQADEDLANDLVGSRLTLSAELLAGGLGDNEREELERHEHEARELFTAATRTGRSAWTLREPP